MSSDEVVARWLRCHRNMLDETVQEGYSLAFLNRLLQRAAATERKCALCEVAERPRCAP